MLWFDKLGVESGILCFLFICCNHLLASQAIRMSSRIWELQLQGNRVPPNFLQRGMTYSEQRSLSPIPQALSPICPLRPGLNLPFLRPWTYRPSPGESDSNPEGLCHSALSQEERWGSSTTFAKQLRNLYVLGINHGQRKWKNSMFLDFKYHFSKWMSLFFPSSISFLMNCP